jgi:thioredoxin reductase (NADPH)
MDTDLLIIGGGPAGLTAGMYAARARIPVILLEKGLAGGQMGATETIENYPGFSEPILGFELAQKMEEHAKRFGVKVFQEEVTDLAPNDQGFVVNTDSGQSYEAKAIILACGASPVKLGIPGELDLAGKGVSYCAVCDGPFFRDDEVAVIGGGDSAVEEAVYLARFASGVHLIHRRDELRAIKDIQERAFNEPKVTIHWSHVPVEITGDSEVKILKIRSVKDGKESELPVKGVFFYVGLKPNTSGVQCPVETDEAGFVITDTEMACSLPGIFAAGDVRSKQLRQISTAVGDGALAAYSAQQYLLSLKT